MTRRTSRRAFSWRGAAALGTLAALLRLPAEATGSVSSVSATPSPAGAGAEVTITLGGSGTCATYVTFGDNQKSARLTQLPATVKHTYAAPGRYVIRSLSYRSGNEAPGLSPCAGVADMELVVNPKAATASGTAERGLAPAAGKGGSPQHDQELTKVKMTFQKIQVTNTDGKTAAKDDWQAGGTPSPSPTPTPTPTAARNTTAK